MGDRSGQQQKVALELKRRRSDATFWRDGTVTDVAYWGEWQARMWKRAGWKRVLRWLGTVTFGAAAGWGLLYHRAGTERATAVAFGLLAGFGLIRAAAWWTDFGHYRSKVRPLACALAPVLDQPVPQARSWLHVPADYANREDAQVIIDVPHDFTAADRDMEDVTRAVTVKLGLLSPKVTPALDSRHPRLVYTRSAPPPLSVTFSDIRADILAAKPSEVILGLGQPAGGKRQVTKIDLDSETPMAAASMTTGDGKSALARNFGAQMAYHGAQLIILDYKWFSHMWADGLPGVCYARTPEEIHQVLVWLAYDERDLEGTVVRPSELTRRKQIGLAAERAGVPAKVGHRILVIAEEGNSTAKVLKRYWRGIGGKGPCPSLEALDEIGATGRQLCVNVLYIAQRLSARASGSDGSADARENIGAIITKDPTEATWNMLAAGHAQPRASGHKGRYQLVLRKEVSEFQGALWTPAEAREFATSGIVAEPPRDMPFVTRRDLVPAGVRQLDSGAREAPDLGLVAAVPTALPAGGTVKLADMVAAGLFVTIHAARKASTRDPLFPRRVEGMGSKHTGWHYTVTDVHKYLAAKGRL